MATGPEKEKTITAFAKPLVDRPQED